MMANSNRKLFGHECGMGRYDGSTYNFAGTIDDNFDKTMS